MSFTLVRTFTMGVVETLVHTERRLRLWLYRWAGSLHRRTSRGWGPVARWLAIVSVALLVLPWVLDRLLALVPAGIWNSLTDNGSRDAGEWWSVRNVLIVSGAVLALRWLSRARERVVIEEFVDYTNKDAQAVKGLATLLVAELSRLHELYGHVNDQLSTPMSVGVQHRGGAGAGTEPGAFLSVRADDVTGTLNDAIATESKVEIGGFKIPIGFVLSLLGRVARGPRIIGSLHYTDAVGEPTLTAQIVGRGASQQWRVDAPAGAHGFDKAFLDPMVTELACRMFNELTLRGSVRWRAIRAFTEYLELYWESHRTPKDRARNLRRAETSLLRAIAEDETFDLAYYNLGVIYSKLAETEHAAAQASEYVTKNDDPDTAYQARLEAALAAFNRAVTLNRDRAEAIYALAVHEFARIQGGGAKDDLDCIVCRCDRVLELDKRHAQAHDLKGMALLQLEHPAKAERSHRKAVRLSWRRLRRAEFAERAVPPTTESALAGAKANTAAALHNLAEVHRARAQRKCRRLRLVRADRMYRRARRLAPTETRAATLLARGRMLDERGKPGKARDCYDAALKIDPENPVHWAHLASAHAADGDEKKARRLAESALNELAPIYRRTLELHQPAALLTMRDNTLAALKRTYTTLDGSATRIDRIETLWDELEAATADPDADALVKLKARFDGDRVWEREQVQIALARTLGRLGRWEDASDEYGDLIGMLEAHRPQGVVQHSLHAKQAKALRRTGAYHEALVEAARGQLQDPLSASARREVGKAHFALLQYEEALDAWEHTLWLTPNDPYLHWKVAFCHWSVAQDRRDPGARRDSLVAAANGFEQAATLFGVRILKGWAWSQLWAGRVRAELGDHDDAVRHLRSATGCEQTALAGALLLGEEYRTVGERSLSRLHFERAYETVSTRIDGGNVDADWGETLPSREVAVRAAVGLGLSDLEVDGDYGAALERAQEARDVAAELQEEPRAAARCMAAVADLTARAARAAQRNGNQPALSR
jgi:tetratricopeptide (TPR) repeat protein